MRAHELFDLIANEDLRTLIHSPALDQSEKLFVCGYVAYEAGQYVLAHGIFSQLYRAKVYPEETFYAVARCLIDAGATVEALRFIVDGNPGSRVGRYLLSFMRENGLESMAERLEADTMAFFENYMASQVENSDHGFPKYLHPESFLDRVFKPVFDHVKSAATVLDVGCNLGHMLEYLRCRSFSDSFFGVEINQFAIAEFGRRYPETFAKTTLHSGTAMVQFKKFADKSVDLVYSQSVLTAIPDSNAIREMARIAGKYVYFGESDNRNKCLLPNGNVFHDYKGIMDACGFDLVYEEMPPGEKRYYATKVFRLFKRRG